MSLPVPLTVAVNGKAVTREAVGLSFRKDAIGGVQSISLRLSRPLDRYDPDLRPWKIVTIYDARSAEIVAEGRIAELGRSASSSDGQVFEVNCFGPAQHAWDKTVPLIYVDQSLTDGWRQVERIQKGGTWSQSSMPDNTADSAAEAQVFQFPEGSTVATNDELTARYERLREAGQKVARVSATWDAGSTDANYRAKMFVRTNGAGGTAVFNATFNTAGGTTSGVVVTDWANDGKNTVDTKIVFTGATGKPANDNKWAAFSDIVIRGMLLNADGTDRTSYGFNYVIAHDIVNDLLGRLLDQYDGATATVDTSGTYQIDSLVYPDGVAAGDVLADLMALEPAFRWTVGPGGAFSWELWPTTVRYEVSLEDGGSFPVTGQEQFNQVEVRWRDKRGRTRTNLRTAACPDLDAEGLTRTAHIDLGDEVASSNNADRIGDNFLARHRTAINAGTLNVSRPIRDLETGRMVRPHEIEPGELIRVRGVESYPDALNASSNDGLTVFRVWSVTYNSDSDTATLELDSYSRETAYRLGLLARTKRGRKR